MTIRRHWEEYRSLLAVLSVIAVVGAVAASCGGQSNGGENNGDLCQQCGDTDGPCQGMIQLFPDDGRERPSFCPPLPAVCDVGLVCLRKLDSAQRRCYPQTVPTPGTLDILYRCQGDRPNPNTVTPQPSRTPTPSTSPSNTQDVTISIDTGTFLGVFTVGVRYPSSRGSFTQNNSRNCVADDDIAPESTTDSNGALNLNFGPAADLDSTTFDVTCTFYLSGEDEISDEDLRTVAPTGIDAEASVS